MCTRVVLVCTAILFSPTDLWPVPCVIIVVVVVAIVTVSSNMEQPRRVRARVRAWLVVATSDRHVTTAVTIVSMCLYRANNQSQDSL